MFLALKMPKFFFFFFADDVKLFKSLQSVSDCSSLQGDIDSVFKWCTENCLSLNPQKTRSIVLTRKRERISFAYTVGGVHIPPYCLSEILASVLSAHFLLIIMLQQ